MKSTVANSVRLAIRFLIIWLIEAVALLFLATRFPGLGFSSTAAPFLVESTVLIAFALSTINILIPPLLILAHLPLNALTIVLSAIIINSLALRLVDTQWSDFVVGPFLPNALYAAFTISVLNTVLTALIALDDDYAFFQFAMHMLVHRMGIQRAMQKPGGSRGMVIVQIDGLSPVRLQFAVTEGLMPNLKALLTSGTHKVTSYDCGLPSQTSACQAGIMYGNNINIPAFRWYDKKLHRIIVSNHLADASLINNMSSTGAGLLRGGSSVSNLVNGDAAKSLLTLSTIRGESRVPTERALEDLSSFWFNPYTFTRTFFATINDLVIEVFEAMRQHLRSETPRISRLISGQLFVRALTNIFLRDLSAYVVMLDINRGVPIIYTTFMGYDQVAHHAGPDSEDALSTLKGLDRQLRHILQTMRRLAPRPYDLYVLSDHGQSFGPTFRQRYNTTLRDLVKQSTSDITSVALVDEHSDKQTYSSALIDELDAANRQLASHPKTRVRRAAMRGTIRTLSRHTQVPAESEVVSDIHIVVCSSGNLAHIYFTLHLHKVPLHEIVVLHPRLIDTLVHHPGIGIVIGIDQSGDIIALGKYGTRNLCNGEITGADPLEQFGNSEVRAQQLRRIASFDNSGDLILNSTCYTDGTVASFEELIGVHGGLGGQQTDGFIVFPQTASLHTELVTNSSQVFDLLNSLRQEEMASPKL